MSAFLARSDWVVLDISGAIIIAMGDMQPVELVIMAVPGEGVTATTDEELEELKLEVFVWDNALVLRVTRTETLVGVTNALALWLVGL